MLAACGVSVALTAVMTDSRYAIIVFTPLVYSLLFLPVPPAVRLVGALPALFVLAYPLIVFESYSGALVVAVVFGYLIVWAWRETSLGVRWTAWVLAGVWSVLALILASVALGEFADGVAIATVALTGLMVVLTGGGMVFQRQLHARAVTVRSP